MMSLRKSLRRGSVWIDHSMRFRDREQMLIPAKEWERDRAKYLALLGLPATADTFIEQLLDTLRAGWGYPVSSDRFVLESDRSVVSL
jgi:hypothetical protein